MAVAIPFIMIAGAVISAAAAIRQGQAAKAAAEYNVKIGEQNAALARDEAQAQMRQQERETYLRLGAIRAAQGKAGGAQGEGSVLDVLGDVAAQSELERQNIAYIGELKARGYTNTATLDRFQGINAERQGQLRAASEMLNGVANAYGGAGRMGAGTQLSRV